MRRFVRNLAAREPDRCFYADQYNNPANPLAHRTTIRPEIWCQTGGQIAPFVTGLGTGGTMTGVDGCLKEQAARVELVGVQPYSPEHGIAGLKHLATAKVPGIYNPHIVDQTVDVRTSETKGMARELAREEGPFLSISAGAAVTAALRVARGVERGSFAGGREFKYAGAPLWTVQGPGVGALGDTFRGDTRNGEPRSCPRIASNGWRDQFRAEPFRVSRITSGSQGRS